MAQLADSKNYFDTSETVQIAAGCSPSVLYITTEQACSFLNTHGEINHKIATLVSSLLLLLLKYTRAACSVFAHQRHPPTRRTHRHPGPCQKVQIFGFRISQAKSKNDTGLYGIVGTVNVLFESFLHISTSTLGHFYVNLSRYFGLEGFFQMLF